jgi:hypothetical protein
MPNVLVHRFLHLKRYTSHLFRSIMDHLQGEVYNSNIMHHSHVWKLLQISASMSSTYHYKIVPDTKVRNKISFN